MSVGFSRKERGGYKGDVWNMDKDSGIEEYAGGSVETENDNGEVGLLVPERSGVVGSLGHEFS